jgi:chromosome segregation and condensation protein ScpB
MEAIGHYDLIANDYMQIAVRHKAYVRRLVRQPSDVSLSLAALKTLRH